MTKPFAKGWRGASQPQYMQVAALCYRQKRDDIQVLLIKSRKTDRWILPRGWPMDGKTPAQAAAREAFEEAGVEGRVSPDPIGAYTYMKMISGQGRRPCAVLVFPLKTKRLVSDYPESGQRKRKWFSLKKAAARVDEPELKYLINDFTAKQVQRLG
jgi:8-oxo-dGTP pyrophosphatase MutT (NUDIX family)